MFTVPASKTSVPEKVVYLIVVSGSANSIPPVTVFIRSVVSSLPNVPDHTHLLPTTLVNVADPYTNPAAVLTEIYSPFGETPVVAALPEKYDINPKYPADKTPFAVPPTLMMVLEVPFVERPYAHTVILLAQLGIPVKSTLVPLAACAVPDTNGASVPSVSSSVSTLLELVAGACTVIVPEPVTLLAKIMLDIH
jgi:hypothetical protein